MIIYNVEQVAELMGIPQVTVRQYLRDGTLEGSKIGKKWLITEKNIEELLEKKSNRKNKEVEKDNKNI